ncbi:MAG: two-component system sensor histidine kinase/response regulator [Sulfurimonas sp.]|jgi:two-component system sensor histidine kinase/response regulator|uniref:hybrid sensor histidine kinase/response regulator n=1 Tax=Sulfurimonas sp. TaxID=2022749 RepID=UPI0039E4D9AB
MDQKIINTKQLTILIVDDTPENLRYLDKLLSANEYDVRGSLDPELALEVALRIKPDLILLDIRMPKMDGYAFSETLQKRAEFNKDTPIIFISALDDVEDKIKAFEAGGVDYITKPFEEKEVLARVNVHLQLNKSKQHIESLLKQQDYFMKKIIHEINTPISVISLNAQLLEMELGKHSSISTIQASTKILSSVYDELNYLVKKELYTYEKDWIKLLEFVSNRIAYFHEIAEVKNIELHLEVDSEFSVYMNSLHLERLVDNTLSNAIKYSNQDTQIELLIGVSDKGFFLNITDEGVGLKDVSIIFQQYYQSSQGNIGLGIGLATVKEICDSYEIDVQVQSEQNRGSVFSYSFPTTMTKIL